MSGNELLAVLLCVGAFALILVVRYLINVGVDKASDKIHRISKKKTAASLPQGRFRLADRRLDIEHFLDALCGNELAGTSCKLISKRRFYL